MQNEYADIVPGNQVYFVDRNGELPSGRYTILEVMGEQPVNEDTQVRIVNDTGTVLVQPAVNLDSVLGRVKLTVDMTFDLNGTGIRFLRENLEQVIRTAIANGDITGRYSAELANGYTIATEEVEVEQPRRDPSKIRTPDAFLDLVRPVMATLVERARGRTMLFKTSMMQKSESNKVFQDHDGQRAELVGIKFDTQSCGNELFDDEVLPAFRVRFPDGIEIDAFCEEFPELPSPDSGEEAANNALDSVYRVCMAYSRVRNMGFIGFEHIGVAGTADQMMSVLDILKN